MGNKKTVINLAAAFITLVVQMIISFWLSPFVVAKLGEEAYGFLNLANNFVSYASLISVAINSMASRYISLEYNRGNIESSKKYFGSVFIVNCILYALILIVSIFFIGNIEQFINVTPALVMQVKATFFLSVINMGVSLIGTVYTAATFATGLMHINSIIQIIGNVVKSVLIFALFMILPAKIYFLSIAILLSSIIIFIGNYIWTKKLLKGFTISLKYFDIRKIIQLIKSGIWILASNVSNLLLNGLDLLFSNIFISGAIMGRLSLAKQIPMALANALGVFSNIFSSALTKVFAEKGEKSIADEVNSQLRILTLFFSVVYAGLIVYGRDFLGLWLGEVEYSSQEINQIYVLMLLTLVDIIVSTYMYSIHSVFIAVDAVRIYSITLFVASVISLSVTVLLLNFTPLGVYAIAGTSTIVLGFTHGIIVPAQAAVLLKENRAVFWKTEIKSWAVLLMLTVIFGIIRLLLDSSSWGTFIISVIVCAIIGYGLSFVTVLSHDERQAIMNGAIRTLKKNKGKMDNDG